MKIQTIVGLMPMARRASVAAVIGGDASVAALHAARRDVAAWADSLGGRQRGRAHSAGLAQLSLAAQAAYDELAALLAAQGAL